MSRIKQFFKDITATFKDRDDRFINLYLNEDEKKEFLKLKHAEVLHSIDVAKLTLKDLKLNKDLLENLCDEELYLFIKASMLHDVGKNKYPLNAIKKTLAVLYGKFYHRKDKYIGNNKILDIYINHPEYGYKILKEMNSFKDYPYLYDLVRYHDDFNKYKENKSIKEVNLFKIYKSADDRC